MRSFGIKDLEGEFRQVFEIIRSCLQSIYFSMSYGYPWVFLTLSGLGAALPGSFGINDLDENAARRFRVQGIRRKVFINHKLSG